MKNLYLIVLFVSILFIGCDKENDDCTPESKIGTFIQGRKIVKESVAGSISNYYKVENGSNVVFEYKHAKAQCNNAYDDELLKTLTFEVNTEAAQFRFAGNDIKLSNCYYQEIGTWAGGIYEIESGIIEGTKISENKWKVKVSVLTLPKFPAEKPIKIDFEEVFEK